MWIHHLSFQPTNFKVFNIRFHGFLVAAGLFVRHAPTLYNFTCYCVGLSVTHRNLDSKTPLRMEIPHVAVTCRIEKLFSHVFWMHHCIWTAISLNFCTGRPRGRQAGVYSSICQKLIMKNKLYTKDTKWWQAFSTVCSQSVHCHSWLCSQIQNDYIPSQGS